MCLHCCCELQCVAVMHEVDNDIYEVDKSTVLQCVVVCVAVCVAMCCSDA